MPENHITKIRKRDGSIVLFNQNRIVNAIFNTAKSIGGSDKQLAEEVASKVVQILNERFHANSIPAVEQIQDLLEKVLIEEGHAATAKAFILYRQERARLRDQKKSILDGLLDDSKLDINQVRIVAAKYLARDKNGKIKETPAEMFKRVAKAIAFNENLQESSEKEQEFYNVMRSLDFLPSGRVLANAGIRSKQLASCYVLPVQDNIKGIFDSLKLAAVIQKEGAGTGFDFSLIRPRGSSVSTSPNVTASGVVSFIRLFDSATETIKKGNNRGANMGVLRVDHPDIVNFITSKKNLDLLINFNISVGITDDFMKSLEEKSDYGLIDPHLKKPVGKASAQKVFDIIVRHSWESGEPGLLFLDTINKKNPLPGLGKVSATDPCGELPMLAYESAILGSVNLANMVNNRKIEWKRLKRTVHIGVEMLDNCIDISEYPDKKCENMIKRTRRIALGIMGYADMLYQLRIPYDSEEGINIAKKVMSFIQEEGHNKSIEIGRKKRPFRSFSKSIFVKDNLPMRNSSITSIGPTGTISMVANVSAGCEPNFGLGFIKKVLGNQEFVYINKYFEEAAKEEGFYSEELIKKIAERGSVQGLDKVPEHLQKIFVVAHEISPEYHVKTQAALQKYVDSAISKTINFPNTATLDDIKDTFMLAWKMGCKGITIYRDGSRQNQVLNIISVNNQIKEMGTPDF
ncbi:MAG: adenosylcobalamin-dependent ribonucleoside-diphosphate reductase [Candidatus Woesearchaeota archaeon]